MRLHTFALAAVALCGSCTQLTVNAQAGYAQMAIEGDIALNPTAGGGTGSIRQDIETALGLGDDRGAPYLRGELDLGVPVFTVSAFTFEEDGTGTLQANYGNLTAGTDVNSSLDFSNAKFALGFQFNVGPIALQPGIAADYFDLQLDVSDTAGFATESVELSAPVPLVFLRAQADLGTVALTAEVGYLDVPEQDNVEGTLLDAEAFVELRATPMLNLFAGYRAMNVEIEGEVDNQDFFADITVSGWVIGGGVRF